MIDTCDSLSNPFQLPIQTLTFHCQAERSLHFRPGQEGATPGTTLAGAFGEALIRVACTRHRNGTPRCLGMSRGDFVCPEGDACPFPWLFKPYSRIHRRSLGRPLRLRAPELEEDRPVQAFRLQVSLWSQHALAVIEVVAEAVQTMGNNGLNHDGRPVRFRLLDQQVTLPSTFRQRIDALSGPLWHHALLILETPLLVQKRTTDGRGSSRTGTDVDAFRLESLLGNCAYELMAWHLEERGDGNAFDSTTRHALCRNARRSAGETVQANVHRMHNRLFQIDLGSRISRSNRQKYPLNDGLMGHLELTGGINLLLPWLVVLEQFGGGQRRSMGFGAVRLWLR